MNSHNKVIIVGSGPAGLTAAIYAARAELRPLLLAGASFGGQLMLTTDVGNYPGFVEDIKGPELMQRMLGQAKRFGAQAELADVTKVDFSKRPFRIWTDEQEYQAGAVIIATGASAKWMGLPSEERLRGHGVSSCATCDGFFFKGKKVVVVGGGDVAVEEVLGKDKVEGVRVKNLKSGAVQDLAVEGLFVAIGHQPNTKFLQGSGIELDAKGYIKKRERSFTNIEGVFVAGDVEDHLYRQAVTAAGDGCRAAMDAEKWLTEQASKV